MICHESATGVTTLKFSVALRARTYTTFMPTDIPYIYVMIDIWSIKHVNADVKYDYSQEIQTITNTTGHDQVNESSDE